MVFALDKQLLF